MLWKEEKVNIEHFRRAYTLWSLNKMLESKAEEMSIPKGFRGYCCLQL